MSTLGQLQTCPAQDGMSASPLKDGVIGRPSLWIAEDFKVRRFRLMVTAVASSLKVLDLKLPIREADSLCLF